MNGVVPYQYYCSKWGTLKLFGCRSSFIASSYYNHLLVISIIRYGPSQFGPSFPSFSLRVFSVTFLNTTSLTLKCRRLALHCNSSRFVNFWVANQMRVASCLLSNSYRLVLKDSSFESSITYRNLRLGCPTLTGIRAWPP